MKKIQALFHCTFEKQIVTSVLKKVVFSLEWVLAGKGVATVKWDGACCAIIGGEFYKRYDAKGGKLIPEGAIKYEEADSVTGHLPYWGKCGRGEPGDKWFWAAYDRTQPTEDGTYEALRPHFQTNPYHLEYDVLGAYDKDSISNSSEHRKPFVFRHDLSGIPHKIPWEIPPYP